MQKKYIYILSEVGIRNPIVHLFFDTTLKNMGFVKSDENVDITYLSGVIKIDLDSSVYLPLPDLPPNMEGPSLVLSDDDSLRKIVAYIEGDNDIRQDILHNLNKKITTKYSATLNGSPAFQFAMKAYAHFTNPESDTLTISGDNQLIYAWDLERELPVGVIVFKVINNGCYQKAWIVKSFVDAEYRRQGIWSSMWNDLNFICREQNITKIEGRIFKNNISMQKAAEEAGRELNSHNYIYQVK